MLAPRQTNSCQYTCFSFINAQKNLGMIYLTQKSNYKKFNFFFNNCQNS